MQVLYYWNSNKDIIVINFHWKKHMTNQNLTESNTAILNASLQWDQNGHPRSTQFDDIYFSKSSGINEARYVFLSKNNLCARFSQLSSKTFVIGETGFGSGLNFLCSWQLFEQSAPKGATLHFISVEKYPLSWADHARTLTLYPELSQYADQLLDRYIPASNGFHNVEFAGGNIKLTLLFGDVLNTLPMILAKVDAWFLDGFAPLKNPGMWKSQIFRIMAKKSVQGATYATFTAARAVRNSLEEAGFSVIKSRGFGHKRDMIHGSLCTEPKIDNTKRHLWNIYPSYSSSDKSVFIIGGGLSGVSCARSLAERGWQVTLLERHKNIATEASGNPQAILYAKLSPNNTALSQLIAQGYCYTLNILRQLDKQHSGCLNACGVIQLSISEAVRHRYQVLAHIFPKDFLQFLSKEKLSDIAGMKILHDGLFFPEACWVNPSAICRLLTQHQNITVQTNTAIDELVFKENKWLLKNNGRIVANGSTVVIAEGLSSLLNDQLSYIKLNGIRGQITQVLATDRSRMLKTCVCGEGFVIPATDNYHTIGATFDVKSGATQITQDDHLKNVGMQSDWFPEFIQSLGNKEIDIVGGKVGFRCATTDYFPVVGPVFNKEKFIEHFAMLRKDGKHDFQQSVEPYNGLYVTTGHGSRGLITCPISGELIASIINGDPSPVPSDLQDKLNPARFMVRDLLRNKI